MVKGGREGERERGREGERERGREGGNTDRISHVCAVD